ncbi:MAG TPA: hypothetical protein VFA44_04835 [Gaiellaceae bacterium]|nr:hypothetical protein [Gaiellaceae bacterium]
MTAAQFEQLAEADAELVLRWRFTKLCEAGDPCRALLLAVRPELDLELAADLLRAAQAGRQRVA